MARHAKIRTKDVEVMLGGPLPPPPATPPPLVHSKRIFTREEVSAHYELVQALLTQPNLLEREIFKRTRAHFGIGKKRTRELVERVRADWRKAAKDAPHEDKVAAAVRRLNIYRSWAQGQRSEDGKTWVTPPNHQALARYEMLLAQIQGTLAPQVVEVHHALSVNVNTYMASLTPEAMTRVLEKAREMLRLAEQARAMNTIDAMPGGQRRALLNGKANGGSS